MTGDAVVAPMAERSFRKGEAGGSTPSHRANSFEDIVKVGWTDDLDDVCFAYVEPDGALDIHKRTVPRELRRYPMMRSTGSVDHGALAKAVDAVTASDLPPTTKARVLARLGAVGDVVTKAWSDAAREASLTARQRGWKHSYTMGGEDGKGPAVYVHPEAPGHSVSVDSGGRWLHHNVTPQGARSRVNQGDTPSALADHLRTFHEPGEKGDAKPDPKPDAVVNKYITHSGDTWTVHAENDRVLGTHDSKAKAEAQLRAVEWSKHNKSTVAMLAKIGFRVPIERSAPDDARVPFGVDRLVHIVKAEEQRYTLSVVYPCSARGTPEPDFHGDTMSDVELERAAWGFMAKGQDRIGLMHRPGSQGAGKVVESYIWRGESYKMKDSGGAEQEISPGDWVMGIVWTPEAWAAIRGGEITGLSLQGRASKHAMIEE